MMVHRILLLLITIIGIGYSFREERTLYFILVSAQLMNYLFLYAEVPLLEQVSDLRVKLPVSMIVLVHTIVTQKIALFIFH